MLHIGRKNYWKFINFKIKNKEGFPCHIAFGFYDSVNTNDISRGVLYNMGIMYINTELIVNNNFKNSVLPVM
jgi:hypothetical protein